MFILKYFKTTPGRSPIGRQALSVIFELDRFFFEFRVKYFGPYPTRDLVGSGWVGFFSGGLGQIYRVGWPMIRPTVSN